MSEQLHRWSCMIGKVYNDDNIFYHGDVLARERYIDGEAAHEYYTDMKKRMKRVEEISFSAFGETRTIVAPKLTAAIEDQATNITTEWYTEIVRLSTSSLILDDRIISFWQRFFKEYDLFEYENTIFLKRKVEKQTSINVNQLVGEGDKIPTFYKKEFLEGKFRKDPIYIKGNPEDMAVSKQFSDGKVHGVYADVLREKMFEDFSTFSERLERPISDLQYHILHITGEETWIAGARKTGKTSDEVGDAVVYSFKYNPSRKPIRIAWLSLSEESLESARMYLKMNTEFMMDIGLVDEKKSEQTFYVKEIVQEKSRDQQKVERVIAEIKIKYISQGAMRNSKKVSLGGVYDRIIVDEAELITKDYHESLMALVKQEKSQIIFLMNFNREGKKTFGYYRFIEAEKAEFLRNAHGETVDDIVNEIRDREKLGSYDSLDAILAEKDVRQLTQELRSRRALVGARYSIHDNDMLTQQEIDDTCEFFRRENYVTYLTHYECVMPNEASVFDLSNIRIPHDESLKYDFLFFSFDPSKNTQDPSALAIYGYSESPDHPHYNQVVGIEEIAIKGTSIKSQIPHVKNVFDLSMNRYLAPGKHMGSYVFLYDPNGIGQSVRDYLLGVGINKVFGIHVIGNGETEMEEEKVMRVNKPKFIGSLQSAISDGLLIIYESLRETFRQMTIFQEEKTATGLVTYNAPQGDHDDYITCMAMVSYFCVQKGIKHRLLLTNIKDIKDSIDGQLKEDDPLAWERLMQKRELDKKDKAKNTSKRKKRMRRHLY